MMATCVGAALATAAAGIFARLPVALAPGMGAQLFLRLHPLRRRRLRRVRPHLATGARGHLHRRRPVPRQFDLQVALEAGGGGAGAPLRHGIVAGIGLMIAVIGLRWAGLVVAAPGMYIGPGDLGERPVQVATAGLLVTAVLIARRVSGSAPARRRRVRGARRRVRSHHLHRSGGDAALAPAHLSGAGLRRSVRRSHLGACRGHAAAGGPCSTPWGTLIGVASRAGLMDRGRLPRPKPPSPQTRGGTMVGGLLGTSTITTYIESAAGIAAGGRTGITALTTAVLLLCSSFFYPLLSVVGGVPFGDGRDPLPRSRADSDPDRDLHVSADRQGALGPGRSRRSPPFSWWWACR